MSGLRRALLPAAAVLALAAVAFLLSPSRISGPFLSAPAKAPAEAQFATFPREAMATVFQVTLPAGPRAAALADTVFAIFRSVEATMNEWRDGSPLAEVNRQAGVCPVSVPGSLREVIHLGLEAGEATGGAFDITWAALWGLWDFRAPAPRVPDPAEIARRVAQVDYRRVRVDDAAGTVFLPEAGMKIGLGGIAKGYALDRAAARLRAEGVRDFLILGGGQVMAGGRHGERAWRVGIRDPRGAPEDYFATLDVTDASASTSGDYERFFETGGVRYHHILDPRTGMPSRGLRSVTVIGSDATMADALSTALMVLGRERGIEALRRFPGMEAVFVDSAGQATWTPGLEGRIRVIHPPHAGGN